MEWLDQMTLHQIVYILVLIVVSYICRFSYWTDLSCQAMWSKDLFLARRVSVALLWTWMFIATCAYSRLTNTSTVSTPKTWNPCRFEHEQMYTSHLLPPPTPFTYFSYSPPLPPFSFFFSSSSFHPLCLSFLALSLSPPPFPASSAFIICVYISDWKLNSSSLLLLLLAGFGVKGDAKFCFLLQTVWETNDQREKANSLPNPVLKEFQLYGSNTAALL